MTDITALPAKRHAGHRPGTADVGEERPAGEQRLVTMVELLFFAYREFTAEPDAILEEIGYGRAHHRVLHFVSRNPGLRVADLLGVLRITKQSLARVLKQLVDDGYIIQTAGPDDRRERRLTVTERGQTLADRLLANQTKRIAAAMVEAGPEAERLAEAFLLGMIPAGERDQVRRLTGPRPVSAAGQRHEDQS